MNLYLDKQKNSPPRIYLLLLLLLNLSKRDFKINKKKKKKKFVQRNDFSYTCNMEEMFKMKIFIYVKCAEYLAAPRTLISEVSQCGD
jgi:hypothetical protein